MPSHPPHHMLDFLPPWPPWGHWSRGILQEILMERKRMTAVTNPTHTPQVLPLHSRHRRPPPNHHTECLHPKVPTRVNLPATLLQTTPHTLLLLQPLHQDHTLLHLMLLPKHLLREGRSVSELICNFTDINLFYSPMDTPHHPRELTWRRKRNSLRRRSNLVDLSYFLPSPSSLVEKRRMDIMLTPRLDVKSSITVSRELSTLGCALNVS